MNMPRIGPSYLAGVLAILCAPAYATVTIVSIAPSPVSPQPLGTPVVWRVTATDTNPGPLTFQFNTASSLAGFSLARDFNVGTASAGVWTSQPFVWVPTVIEGSHQIQVVVKDFSSGETASQTITYNLTSRVTNGQPVVTPTANPLVALFSTPSCPAGSQMRVAFQQSGSSTFTRTGWLNCHPPLSMNVEIAGMYPATTYVMFAQTYTTGHITNGANVSFTTGTLPSNITFPTFTVNIPAGAQTDSVLLFNLIQFSGIMKSPSLATDLSGNTIWYYYPPGADHVEILAHLLPNGAFLAIQDIPAWNLAAQKGQVLREIDLAGNLIRETNTGVVQQQLLALGATDAQACNAISTPAPVGAACLGAFHHDAIQTLPNGRTAVIADIEKIFPAGTQGDTSGLPVDIIGDMIIVLNSNWQVVWYFDTFQHDSGPPQLDINRPAVLAETCTNGQAGCPPILLLGPGIAPQAKDWLHANSLYYWPQDGAIIWSSRHQDWVMKVDYRNGSGIRGKILWRMGVDGDFTFNNIYNDPWPWFSHQHYVAMQNNGAGPMTILDNGNTRISQVGGNSRGMSLIVDETNLQVTPVLSADLGVFGQAMGTAELLSDGNYFFLAPAVKLISNTAGSYAIQILPTPGTDTGSQVLNVQGPDAYRAWQMPSLYAPPII